METKELNIFNQEYMLSSRADFKSEYDQLIIWAYDEINSLKDLLNSAVVSVKDDPILEFDYMNNTHNSIEYKYLNSSLIGSRKLLNSETPLIEDMMIVWIHREIHFLRDAVFKAIKLPKGVLPDNLPLYQTFMSGNNCMFIYNTSLRQY